MPARTSAPANSAALLTPEEAAAYLNMPLKRLKQHTVAGDIEYIAFGERAKRYERAGLDAFIAARRMRRAN